MATTTNFGWETPDDTDLVKDGAAAIRTLGQAIDTSMADLEGGTTGQVLTKNSATDMDFVWSTPALDSMTLLTTTPITNTGTINVSVAGGYKKLVVYIENFAPALSNDTLLIRFNSDTSNNYDQFAYQANVGDKTPIFSHPQGFMLFGQNNNINTSSNGLFVMELPNYAATNCTKLGTGYLSAIYGGTSSIFHTISSYAYNSISAITTINCSWGTGNWKAQGNIKVYGVN